MYSQQMALRQQCRHPSGEVAEITYAETEQSVVARFVRMVAVYSDKPAIVDLSHALTYAELDQASNRIARALQQRGGQINELVVILMENGTEKLAAIYGAAKAGMCHVMLPVEAPAERLSFMWQDLGHPLLLTDSSNLEMAGSLISSGSELLLVEEVSQNASADPVRLAIGPDTHYFNRRALPTPGRERPPLAVSYTAPRTPLEAELAQIWADVLGVEAVGIHDNFLDLGGDSL